MSTKEIDWHYIQATCKCGAQYTMIVFPMLKFIDAAIE